MGVRKLTTDVLTFKCMGDTADGKCESVVDILVPDVKAMVREDGFAGLVLPACPHCGAMSMCVLGLFETPQYHLIRTLWRRVVAAGSFVDKASETASAKMSANIAAFYEGAGRESLKAQFNNDSSTIELLAVSE